METHALEPYNLKIPLGKKYLEMPQFSNLTHYVSPCRSQKSIGCKIYLRIMGGYQSQAPIKFDLFRTRLSFNEKTPIFTQGIQKTILIFGQIDLRLENLAKHERKISFVKPREINFGVGQKPYPGNLFIKIEL